MEQDEGNNNNGAMFVKVMTDDQMEILRKQIAIYATICEQLVDLHKSLTSHHDLAGWALQLLLNLELCRALFDGTENNFG
ncbi:hypothetical protein E3N88_04993 [Mikania micrantha]|uniref:Uncharacterized protein n=1 Tax=Mikania micrantha TaxID=192012 RepID=A0A5N6PW13_9ASTR|nr:hypothetical protein E3N88_04993 [Mikania micrantha]